MSDQLTHARWVTSYLENRIRTYKNHMTVMLALSLGWAAFMVSQTSDSLLMWVLFVTLQPVVWFLLGLIPKLTISPGSSFLDLRVEHDGNFDDDDLVRSLTAVYPDEDDEHSVITSLDVELDVRSRAFRAGLISLAFSVAGSAFFIISGVLHV